MAKFSYTVKDNSGKTIKNIIDAPSREALVLNLQKQNLFIVNIKELSARKAPAPRKKKKKFARKKIKTEDLLAFARQIATMLEAGITLIRSLDVIQSNIQSQDFATVVKKVRDDIQHGSTLSLALSKHPKVFNQFWVSLSEVGEASGTLPLVFNKLAFYIEQQESFRKTVVSGLIYPAILMFIATGAIFFFALFVGPRFKKIFTDMGAELPAITKVMLATFDFLKMHIKIIVIGLVGLFFGLKYYLKTYSGKTFFENLLLKIPNFGEVYRQYVCERFSSQMAILIDSGVPIIYALDITERLVENNTCALVVNDIKESVKKGELLTTTMDRSGFFPPMVVQMIQAGEETGELSKMLKHVSKFLQETVETFMKRFSTIIEPFMLVFMGAVIGTIVVAMFLPLFNLSQMGHG